MHSTARSLSPRFQGSLAHVDQAANAVGMSPDVVDGIGSRAADIRQLSEQEIFRTLQGSRDFGIAVGAARLDDGIDSEGSNGAAKGVMSTGDGCIDVQALGLGSGDPHEPFLFWSASRKATPFVDGGFDLLDCDRWDVSCVLVTGKFGSREKCGWGQDRGSQQEERSRQGRSSTRWRSPPRCRRAASLLPLSVRSFTCLTTSPS